MYSQPDNPLIDYFQNEGILHIRIGTSELFSDTIFVDNDNIQVGRELTSVNINGLQLGMEVASQIINHSENPDLLSTKIIVPHRIAERGSCSPLLIKRKIEK